MLKRFREEPGFAMFQMEQNLLQEAWRGQLTPACHVPLWQTGSVFGVPTEACLSTPSSVALCLAASYEVWGRVRPWLFPL